MQTEDAHYAKLVEVLMVEATEGFNMELDKCVKIYVVLMLTCNKCTPKPRRG